MAFVNLLRSRVTGKALPQGDGAPLAAPAGQDLPEMSFLEHLEDLRWAILKALAGVLLITIACSFFNEFIVQEVLLGPIHEDFFMYRLMGLDATPIQLQNRDITGQFFAYWGTILAVGLIAGSPIVVYQFWKFLEPGLYPHERKGLRFAAFFATFFFVAGLAFGYCIITPMALQFFQNFTIDPNIVNEFDISKYFGMVTTWAFGTGILFELPVVVYFLAKLGIVSAAQMRAGRKYASIVILIIAAVLTPPDVISQILTSIPLFILYELSIVIAERVEKNRAKELKAALE